jgi:hypothetical protein
MAEQAVDIDKVYIYRILNRIYEDHPRFFRRRKPYWKIALFLRGHYFGVKDISISKLLICIEQWCVEKEI